MLLDVAASLTKAPAHLLFQSLPDWQPCDLSGQAVREQGLFPRTNCAAFWLLSTRERIRLAIRSMACQLLSSYQIPP